MAVTEYVRVLGEGARKRHTHETRRGRLISFVVQLEIEIRGAWIPVVRYDMAHRMAHVDVHETPNRKTKRFLGLSPAEAVTLADDDIRDHWERYRDDYLRRNRR
jgi:hypothetical protein